MIVDKDRFLQVIDKANSEINERLSIGTLSEKTTHRILKNFIDSNKEHQEVKVQSFVADVCFDNQIFEIQTSNFSMLKRKLDVFLPSYHVTVVYPVDAVKYIVWIDNEGNTSNPRKSPKRKFEIELLPNLVSILRYLKNPNLDFDIYLLQSYEYKILNGWSKDKKKGSTRIDKIPQSLLDIISLNYKSLSSLLPSELEEIFSISDFSNLTHLSPRKVSASIKVLKYLNLIEIDHKEKRKIYYRKKSHD